MSTPTMPPVPGVPTQEALPPQLPLYDANNAEQRMQIRSGQSDPVGARRYKKSKTGAYEMARDPNRDVNQAMQDNVRRKGYDYGSQQQRTLDTVETMDSRDTQFSLENAWNAQKTRQEEEYAAYYAEAQQMAAQPFRWNTTNFDGSNSSGWSFQMLDTNSLGQIRTTIVNSAVAAARSGVQYSWGGGGIGGPSRGVNWNGRDGTSRYGFDCSGLVQFAYGQAGINLPRVSSQQSMAGTITPIGSLRAGDIVGWGSNPRSAYHVAVYLGNGYISEAANERSGMRIRRLSDAEMRGQGAFGVSILGGGR